MWAIDSVFMERLWRSVKFEEVYLEDYVDCWEAEASQAAYFRFYDHERIHQSPGCRTPVEFCRNRGVSCKGWSGEDQVEVVALKGITG